MTNNWRQELLANLKNSIKPKLILEFLKDFPIVPTFFVAIFFSYIYTTARINERYDLVGLDSPRNLLSGDGIDAYGDLEEYIPPEGTLCADIGVLTTRSKYLLKNAYLGEFIANKYPDFETMSDDEWFKKVSPILEDISYAVEESCKKSAIKIAPKGWWYAFSMTTIFNMVMISIGKFFIEKRQTY